MLENNLEFDLEQSFKRESQEYHLITGDNRAIFLLCSPVFPLFIFKSTFYSTGKKRIVVVVVK